MKGVMIQGTSSDSGKSFITTALCRIFSDMGYKVCPFKSQNMSNNSFVTVNGLEMGRAQAVQAEAARIQPDVFMNPILLKPQKDAPVEIILMGEIYDLPIGSKYKDFTMTKGLETLRSCLRQIENNFELMVIEGAGSPAEINLNEHEIVNMRVAREADVPVILVADVNRGGALASIVGTLELLGEDRKRVKGLIFNKFQGDVALFQNAVTWIEKKTGIKVLGVMPWLNDIMIDSEDSLSVNWKTRINKNAKLTIGVVQLPFATNLTDLDDFDFEPDVQLIEIDKNSSFDLLNAIIIPSTENPVSDMTYLKESGLSDKIIDFSKNGGIIFGIGGGYQIMGEALSYSCFAISGKKIETEGLGIIPVRTVCDGEKNSGEIFGQTVHSQIKNGIPITGHNLYIEKTELYQKGNDFEPLFEFGGTSDGFANQSMKIAATCIHDIFKNDKFRNFWLNIIRRSKELPELETIDMRASKEKNYDALATKVKENIDIDYVLKNIIKI